MTAKWKIIFKDEIEEEKADASHKAEQSVMLQSIKNIMKNFGVSADKAMESLEIPQNQRSVYAGLIENGA